MFIYPKEPRSVKPISGQVDNSRGSYFLFKKRKSLFSDTVSKVQHKTLNPYLTKSNSIPIWRINISLTESNSSHVFLITYPYAFEYRPPWQKKHFLKMFLNIFLQIFITMNKFPYLIRKYLMCWGTWCSW